MLSHVALGEWDALLPAGGRGVGMEGKPCPPCPWLSEREMTTLDARGAGMATLAGFWRTLLELQVEGGAYSSRLGTLHS